jgi:sec-independent protein translocase protein TatC
LEELRSRLLRAAVYICLGAGVMWFCFDPIYAFLARPIVEPLRASGDKLNYRTFLEPFMIRVQIAMVGGLILALPLITWEVWAFVAPGLTRSERRAIRPVIPASMVLFAMGVGLAYLLTGPSVEWMMKFRLPETQALLNLSDNLLLVLKFYLVFGLGFQIPVVLVVLSALGIVNAGLLWRYWREAAVAIFVLAAVITPTWDPLTMSLAALPMVFLYLATIGVIRVMERRRVRQEAREGVEAG